MRITKKVLFLVGVLVVISAGALIAQDAYYVQSVKAKVLSAPSFKSSVLGEASRGTRLTSVGREGRWIKVSYYGKEGYVAALLLSSHPPMARQGLIKADDSELRQGVRRRASTYTSAAAARGLAQDDRRRLSRDEKTDYDGLEKMEAFSVSDSDLARFMEGGKI